MKKTAQLLLSSTFAVVCLTACGGGENERTPGVLELERDAAAGSVVYEETCMTCHGEDLTGGGGGPDITGVGDAYTDEEASNLILNGSAFMPAFADELDDQQVADLLGYLRTQW